MKIALLTGGPSLERGISLNSSRSVLDHLEGDEIEIIPIYFDHKKKAYKISTAQLYSNSPSDFDFKLHQNSLPLTSKSLIRLLKTVDVVFPVIHGPFGEDGEIQSFLEKNKIPFIGSKSNVCKIAFDKYKANETIKKNGFYILPSALLKIYSKNNQKIVNNFFKKYKIKRAIVKPATGGSSIGVFSVNSPKEAIEKINLLFSKRMDTRVVLEPFAQGKEFTAIILENKFGIPVTIMPTEIETAYKDGQIFDFRKKYLPTNQVKYHCPPNFSDEIIRKIRIQAEQLFKLFGMNDMARFDGWVLNNGEIWFSDFNPTPGMEQNSFLFQQSSRLGMSHRDLLLYVVRNSCLRQKINFPEAIFHQETKRKDVAVVFGGHTSERQVSLMSGTNVWLKLRKSKIYKPKPYLLDFENNVWELPYTLILNHTVEEIIDNIKRANLDQNKIEKMLKEVKDKLFLEDKNISDPFFLPKKYSFKEFAKKTEYVFLGLHGGDGENGKFQKILSDLGKKFNGSSEKTSQLCMDKFNTGEFIRKLGIPGVNITQQKIISFRELNNSSLKNLWNSLCKEFKAKTIIIKPRADGCSTGVAHLGSYLDLVNYLSYLKRGDIFIPPNVLTKHNSIVEMPNKKIDDILFEKFIETDLVRIKRNKLKYKRKSGWVEITIGILEKNKKLHAFNPSITIAEGAVLSLEEKFQGGTGINLTPPPEEIIKPKALMNSRILAEKLSNKIGIKGYARIDAFMNVLTGELLIIEVNTLPALTPSTVIYHQALVEETPIFPVELLEQLIINKGY